MNVCVSRKISKTDWSSYFKESFYWSYQGLNEFWRMCLAIHPRKSEIISWFLKQEYCENFINPPLNFSLSKYSLIYNVCTSICGVAKLLYIQEDMSFGYFIILLYRFLSFYLLSLKMSQTAEQIQFSGTIHQISRWIQAIFLPSNKEL